MQYLWTKKYSFLESRLLQLPLLYLLTFLIPFLLKGPQILIGTLINFVLILSISRFKFKQVLPALILPSISIYIHGLLFGGATNFLIFLIPIIALGNTCYVLSFKKLQDKFNPQSIAIILSSIFKSLFLFLSTFILVKLLNLPQILLSAMGIIQLLTGTLGGLLAVGILNINKLLEP